MPPSGLCPASPRPCGQVRSAGGLCRHNRDCMAASSYVGNRGLVARYAVLADIVDHQLLSLHCIFRRASPSSAIAKYPIIGARWMSAKDMSAPQRYSVSATSRSNAASASGAASKPL